MLALAINAANFEIFSRMAKRHDGAGISIYSLGFDYCKERIMSSRRRKT